MLTEKDLEEVQEKMDFATNAGVVYMSLRNMQSNVRNKLRHFKSILLNPEIATDISEQLWPEDPSQPDINRETHWTGRACEEYAAFIVQYQLAELEDDLLEYQEKLDEFIHILNTPVFHAALAEEKKLDDLRIKKFEEAEAND